MFEWLKAKSGPKPLEDNLLTPAHTSEAPKRATESHADFTDVAAMVNSVEQKDFDWVNYQMMANGGMNSMFMGEFNIIPTIRVMKQLHFQEFWINANVNAVAKPFQDSKMILIFSGGDKDKIVKKHPILNYLGEAGADVENPSFMNANTVSEMQLSGNAYWWSPKDLKNRRRIPVEQLEPVIENNRVVNYRIVSRGNLSNLPDGVGMLIEPEDIIHFKCPNPYTPHIGLSPYIASVLPTLIDKYGREYVLGFFLRGGNNAGIIETNTTNMDQLLRLFKSIMQAFGGRKNMHADKVLPAGATWKAKGAHFGEIRLVELFQENISLFKAAGGTNNAALGLGDQNNRATAYAEMEFFWRNTILPYQNLICQAIKSSSIWGRFGLDSNWRLAFDNSHVPYLDEFDRRVEQDKSLAVLTINERRERLGFKTLPDYDVLLSQLPNPNAGAQFLSAQPEIGEIKEVKDSEPAEIVEADQKSVWKSAELNLQEPTKKVTSLFRKEFNAWEEIVVENLENKEAAVKKIQKRSEDFSKNFASEAIEPAMVAYQNQINTPADKSFRKKESEQDRKAKLELLKERAKEIVEHKILEGQNDSFKGYSQTAMDSIYDFIAGELEKGSSLSEVAAAVRMKFNQSYGLEEAYEGQAKTIVDTEYGSALAIGQRQFAEDLTTVTTKMSKTWISMGDDGHTRPSHLQVDNVTITGDSEEILDAIFDDVGLRYPKDPEGEAEEVINCRCTIQYAPVDWKE